MAKHNFPEFDDLEPEGGTIHTNGHQAVGAHGLDPEDADSMNEALMEDDLAVDYLDEFDDEDELYDELLDGFADFDEFDDGAWTELENEDEFPPSSRRTRRAATGQQPARHNTQRKPIRPQRRPRPSAAQKVPAAAKRPVEPTTTGRQDRHSTQLLLATWLARRAAKSTDQATAIHLIVAATGAVVQAEPVAKAQWQLLPVLLQRVPKTVALLHRRQRTRLLLAQWPQLVAQTLQQLTRLATQGRPVTPALVAAVLQRLLQRGFQQQLQGAQRSAGQRRAALRDEAEQAAAEWWDDESDL